MGQGMLARGRRGGIGAAATLLAAVAAALALPASVWADAAGDAALAKLVQTYKSLPGYVSEVKFENVHAERGWTTTQAGVFRAAVDRSGKRLRYERPDVLLVIDAGRMKVRSNQVPGRFLDAPAPQSLSYETLQESFPYVAPPPAVDLALLLSDDPMETIFRGLSSPGTEFPARLVREVKALPPDDLKRPGLEASAELGRVTLRMDPLTGLVSRATFDRAVPEELAAAGTRAGLVYAIVASGKAPAADEKAFEFVGEGRAVATVSKWLNGDAGAGANGGNGNEEGAEKLEGLAAPAVELKTLEGAAYKLADDKAKVVVLDFWATWCGPCAAWMPRLEAIARWAREGKKEVAFYTVNLRETPEQVKRFMAMAKVGLPVLMDTTGDIGQAYRANAIPLTVVIAGGKVRHVHVGAGPTTSAELKQQITALLAEAK